MEQPKANVTSIWGHSLQDFYDRYDPGDDRFDRELLMIYKLKLTHIIDDLLEENQLRFATILRDGVNTWMTGKVLRRRHEEPSRGIEIIIVLPSEQPFSQYTEEQQSILQKADMCHICGTMEDAMEKLVSLSSRVLLFSFATERDQILQMANRQSKEVVINSPEKMLEFYMSIR